MKQLTIIREGEPSTLEKLARKIQPTDEQLAEANKLPAYSRMARRLVQAKDVPQVAKGLSDGPPQRLGAAVKTRDNKAMVFYTDGSLRHAGGRIKGKAARKRLKRSLHAQRSHS